jgi:hypothetical protein
MVEDLREKVTHLGIFGTLHKQERIRILFE